MFDFKKILSAVVSMALCCSVVTAIPAAAANGCYKSYDTVKSVPDDKSSGKNICSMQGMAVGSSFIYTAKTDVDNTRAIIYKYSIKKGTNTPLKYVNGGKTMNYIPDLLGHANDMCVNKENDKSCLYIATASSKIVKMKVDDSKIYKAGTFDVKNKLTKKPFDVTAVTVLDKSGVDLNLLLKSDETVYHATVKTTATSGTIEAIPVFSLDTKTITIDGKKTTLKNYANQGMSYCSKNDKLYVPLSSKDNRNVSVVLVFDRIKSRVSVGKNSPKTTPFTYPASTNPSFYINSKAYSDLFEIESCGVCSSDGRLYFNTNRRKSPIDTNHDAILRFKDYSAF